MVLSLSRSIRLWWLMLPRAATTLSLMSDTWRDLDR
jgi:hypothetical protein